MRVLGRVISMQSELNEYYEGVVTNASFHRQFCGVQLKNGQRVFCHKKKMILPAGHFCLVRPGLRLVLKVTATPNKITPFEAIEARFHESETFELPKREVSVISYLDGTSRGFAARDCGCEIFLFLRNFRTDDSDALANLRVGTRIEHSVRTNNGRVVATDIKMLPLAEIQK